MILEELKKYFNETKVLVEGTAILPEVIERMNIKNNRVVFIVPTAKFQLEHYKKRNFIPYVLEGCKNKKKAFENWMKRDIEFANEVARQAKSNDRNLLITDGNNTLQENLKIVENYFDLI